MNHVERILGELKALYDACLAEKQYQTALRIKQLEVQLLGLITKKSEKAISQNPTIAELEAMPLPEFEHFLERLIALLSKKEEEGAAPLSHDGR